MPDNLERHVNLGRAARGVYLRGLSLPQACPEIGELQLIGADLEKIERGVRIARAADSMVAKMDSMRTEFPPYGLVSLRDTSEWIPFRQFDLEKGFSVVRKDLQLQVKDSESRVPGNYREILGRFAGALSTTMLYALLSEAKAGNPAITELPYVVDPQLGDPVRDIDRGVGTATQAIINVLHTILLEYQLQTGHLPKFEEFREIAMGSTDIVLRLAALNSDFAQRLPVFFDEDFTDESALQMFRLDLRDRKLEFAQPYFDDRTSVESIPYQTNVTTGCPARVQMDLRKPSPLSYSKNLSSIN